MDTLTPTAIGTLLSEFSLPVVVIAILGGLIGQLVKHILKETVPVSVYNKTCEQQSKMESAIGKNTDAVHEVVNGQEKTNLLIELLVSKAGGTAQ